MDEKERVEILEGVYYGIINETNLPVNLYLFTSGELFSAVQKGYGKRLSDMVILDSEYNLMNEFKDNINIFSGAKTFQQIKDCQNFILDSEGAMRPIGDYIKDVKNIDALYNENWLAVERDMAIKRAEQARYWREIQKRKSVFPLLQYVTAGDERVRKSHAILDKIVKPVNDPFWHKYMPPLDWSCRCMVIQLEENELDITPDDKIDYDELNKSVPALFQNNPAMDKYIFKTEGYGVHPYMKVEKKYEVLKSNNFGLPKDF